MRIPQTTNEAIPAGLYLATVTSFDEEEQVGQHGPYHMVRFKILEGEYAGKEISTPASPKFSPKSKLYVITQAALASPIPEDMDFDSDALIGRVLYINVDITVKEGQRYNKIASYAPAPGKAALASAEEERF